ncbi:MAG: phosphopentomutase [Marmoricola sp.]|nr:phosphopentomutase [Marmoricola sp.]
MAPSDNATDGQGRRALCVILDGFGVGAMPDAEQEGTGNTAERVAQGNDGLALPTLGRLGLGNLTTIKGVPEAKDSAIGAWGRAAIRHAGADTYLGHQEMMGTVPPSPAKSVLADIGDGLLLGLQERGHDGVKLELDSGAVLLFGDIVVADNIEAAYGMNINVTASMDEVDFEDVVTLAQAVRELVGVTRVIAVGGRGYRRDDILSSVRRHEQSHVGVDTPALGVYDEHYLVRHLGIQVPTHLQAPSLAKAAGLPVVLLGKAADVVTCPDAEVCDPVIATDGVFDGIEEALRTLETGLIVANVQETDLAGHEENVQRYGDVLRAVDRRLAGVLEMLRPEDLLIITADHGNDPTVGSSAHTREYVPVLTYGAGVEGELGTRETLADVGATLAGWLGCGPTPDGTDLVHKK